MYLLFAITGYFLLAIVSILDKFILTKSVNKPVVYTFYSTIFLFGVFLLYPFGVNLLIGIDWLLALVSGITFGLGLWFFYIAVKKGEATHITPFNGAVITIVTFFLSLVFLQESLSSLQIVGIIVLVFSSFLLSFEKSLKHSGFHIGFVFAIISGVFFAVSHVSAKYLYDIYDFWTGFVWSKGAVGFVGLFTLLYPSVRHSFKKKKKEKTLAKKHALSIVMVDKVLSTGAVILIQYAAAIGSVTIVFALAGSQYVFMFLVALFMTKFFKKIFYEYFDKKEMTLEIIAILLVALGSIFFVL